MFEYRYLPASRVRFEDLDGVRWHYVEAPPALAHQMPGVPTSQHEHGVIATERYLLEKTLEKAGLERLE